MQIRLSNKLIPLPFGGFRLSSNVKSAATGPSREKGGCAWTTPGLKNCAPSAARRLTSTRTVPAVSSIRRRGRRSRESGNQGRGAAGRNRRPTRRRAKRGAPPAMRGGGRNGAPTGAAPQLSIFSALMKASCGMSTRPNWRIFFFPSFCLSRSLRFLVASPP